MIRGLIFDCDGLLLDTEMPGFQAWQEVYQRHGTELPPEVYATCLGGSNTHFDACAYLEELLGRPVDREDIHRRRDIRKAALVADLPALPGVMEYIDEARVLGLKLSVASSSSRAWVIGHLDRLGILDRFTCVRCREDVEQVKPSPELFLSSLSCLHLRADEAIVFEDSTNGIAAARAAGIFTVAVPNDLSRLLPLGEPDLQLNSLAELPLPALLKRVERARAGV